jgi:hypothetical protein
MLICLARLKSMVVQYVDEVARINYQLGVDDEKETESGKILAAGAAGLAIGLFIYRFGQKGWNKLKSRLVEKKQHLKRQSEEAKQRFVQSISGKNISDEDTFSNKKGDDTKA